MIGSDNSMMGAPNRRGTHSSGYRKVLQPRLVELIAGLRRHQVEEAVQLLLDYIDNSTAAPAVADADGTAAILVRQIRERLADYHLALDQRDPSNEAATGLAAAVEAVLGVPWQPGRELSQRQGSPS